MFAKTFIILGLFLFVFTAIPPVCAQDDAPVGTIIEVEGAATIRREGSEDVQPAVLDMEVFMGDYIEAQTEARAMVLLIDNTEITLGEGSSLKVDEYIFDADDTTQNKGRFSVLKGSFLFVSGLMTKNDKPDVEINTAYGSIGIRGTTLWGGILDEEYGVLVQDGEVHFKTDRATTRIKKGMGSFVKDRKSIPSTPAGWSEEKMGRAVRKVALQHRAEVKERIEVRKQKHQEMRVRHKEAVKQRREKIKEHREDRKEQLQDQRDERKESLKEHQEQRKGEFQDRRKEYIENRQENFEERKEEGQEHREGIKEDRQDRFEDKKEYWQEQREQKKESFQDRREQRKQNFQERRNNINERRH